MLSTKVTDGASSVAEATDFNADSNAPKNATCSANGMRSRTSDGSTFCGSSLRSACASPGMIKSALATRNIGTKANAK